MKNYNIDWIFNDNDELIQDSEFYLGSFNSNDTITLNTIVWNNRYGEYSIDTIEDARLAIYFEKAEDSIILNYLTVMINDERVPMDIDINKCLCNIGELSGKSNNGSVNENNKQNYKQITLLFENLPYNLSNGLKTMYLDIETN